MTIICRKICSLVLLFSCTCLLAERPNVIFFSVDDMNTMIGPHGHKQALTPNLDRLAARGVTFTNAHAPASFCAPSRTAIWTGLQASTTGCYSTEVYHYDFPDIVPLQLILKNGGYDCYGSGKLFHHREGYLDKRGWKAYFGRNQEVIDGGYNTGYHGEDLPLPSPYPYSSYFKSGVNKINGGRFMEWGPIPNDKAAEMMDNQRSDYICEIIKKKHDKPFFAALGLYCPHYPNYVPQKYWDMYDIEKIQVPEIKEDDLEDLPMPIKEHMRSRQKRMYSYLKSIGAYKESIKGYLAAITYADAMLGQVLDALEEGPNKDNTIVILWSDQGYHLGEKGYWGKHTSWRETTTVPFIFAGAQLPKNVKIDETVGLIDLYPTLVELCGLPNPERLDGESLASVVSDPSRAVERTLFIPAAKRGGYAVVNKDWRYIHYGNGTEELYDLSKDPCEYDNLAKKDGYEEVINDLKKAAPSSFRKPATSKNKLKLVLEGDGEFHWVGKSPKTKPQATL